MIPSSTMGRGKDADFIRRLELVRARRDVLLAHSSRFITLTQGHFARVLSANRGKNIDLLGGERNAEIQGFIRSGGDACYGLA